MERHTTVFLPMFLLYIKKNMCHKSPTVYTECHLLLSLVELQNFRKFTQKPSI